MANRTLLEGGCRVIIISPQPWNGFKVSKHHYAEEISRLGNQVYFVNPPVVDHSVRRGFTKVGLTETPGIQAVDYRPNLPYKLKFHFRPAFNWMMGRQAKKIAATCGASIDFVWDFDNTYNFTSLRSFGAATNIFHPVDQLAVGFSIKKDADVVFSVAESIMERVDTGSTPKLVIGHGLSREYADFAKEKLVESAPSISPPLTIGYVGNLLSPAVDGQTILNIVNENPDLRFEFFGPFLDQQTNLPGATWIESLMRSPACNFHGLSSAAEILSNADKIHGWMICYDNDKDINNGADSHKVLEYLATGAPIVSSHLDAYEGTDLLFMPEAKDNKKLPQCFAKMKERLASNCDPKRIKRLEFALDRSYENRISQICSFMKSTI